MTPERERSAIERLRRRTVEAIRYAWPKRNHPAAEGRTRPFLRRKIDEVRALDFLARFGETRDQLAALREAVREVLEDPHAYVGRREHAVLTAALADTAQAAEAHDAKVRREVLREAADAIDYDSHHAQAVAVLRAMADEETR